VQSVRAGESAAEGDDVIGRRRCARSDGKGSTTASTAPEP